MSGNFFDKYPYTDFHELNLDWILKTVKDSEKKIDDFTIYNAITWAGDWDASKTYVQWAIVQDSDGNGYISIKPVPANINITDNTYWAQIASYHSMYEAFNQRITNLERQVPHYVESTKSIVFSGEVIKNE